jgi:hypothetical protein
MLVCLALGISMPEPLFEGFEDQNFKDPDMFPPPPPESNEASVLDHFAPTIPIYYVEL